MNTYTRGILRTGKRIAQSHRLTVWFRVKLLLTLAYCWVQDTLRGYGNHAFHGGPFGLNDPIWNEVK